MRIDKEIDLIRGKIYRYTSSGFQKLKFLKRTTERVHFKSINYRSEHSFTPNKKGIVKLSRNDSDDNWFFNPEDQSSFKFGR